MEPGLTQRPPKRPTLGFLMSISSLLAKLSTKRKLPKLKRPQNDAVIIHNVPPKSPLITKSKELLAQISNKAITLVHHHKMRRGVELEETEWNPREEEEEEEEEEEDFGEGGVWQKAILMGDKCQPLDFSGAIYYDSSGKMLNGVPLRSPRASPLPSYLSILPKYPK